MPISISRIGGQRTRRRLVNAAVWRIFREPHAPQRQVPFCMAMEEVMLTITLSVSDFSAGYYAPNSLGEVVHLVPLAMLMGFVQRTNSRVSVFDWSDWSLGTLIFRKNDAILHSVRGSKLIVCSAIGPQRALRTYDVNQRRIRYRASRGDLQQNETYQLLPDLDLDLEHVFKNAITKPPHSIQKQYPGGTLLDGSERLRNIWMTEDAIFLIAFVSVLCRLAHGPILTRHCYGLQEGSHCTCRMATF